MNTTASSEVAEEGALLRALVQDVPVAVVVLSLDRRVRLWNSGAERMFGWRGAEVLGKPLPTVPADELAEADLIKAQVSAGTALRNIPLNRLTRSGELRPVRLFCSPLRDASNRVIGLLSLYQDPAHGALEERDIVLDVPFRGLVEQSLAGLYIIQDGILQYVNPQYAAMYGYRPEEMIGRLVEEFLVEADRPLYLENLRRRISGEQPSIRYYLRGLHKDGHTVEMEAHGSRFEYRGRPAVVGVQLDISDRKGFERELRESEARLKAMTANVPGVVYQQLLTDSAELHFPYVSDGMQALCGVDPARVESSAAAFLDLLEPADRNRYLVTLGASAVSLSDWNWEGRLQSPQAGLLWLNGRARPRRLPSGDVLWDGLLLNITETKRQAAELHESREQLRDLTIHLNTVREEQRSKIAREIHDVLGGTLTTLKMDLEWAVKQLPTDKAKLRGRAMVGLVQEAVETVRKISADLRPGVLDNLGLLPAIEWQTEELQARMGIACHLSMPEHQPQLPQRDATALFRIFQESLTNIVRHAGASRVEVVVGIAGGRLELTVEDDGGGVTPDQLRNPRAYGILGMFERAREIGAELSIDGQPGLGTRVVLSYPLPHEDSLA